jgi:surface protein
MIMKKYFLLPFIILLFLGSCEKEDQNQDVPQIIKKEKINGFIQKGPFVSGTTVTINELNSEFVQTGKVFTSTIINDLGLFEVNSIELISSFVEFTSSGFYFNEVSGEISNSPITLTTLSDIKDRNSININVLTHLEKRRVETLLKEGKSFSKSKKQSRDELLSIFLMSLNNDSSFEEFDISNNTEEGEILLGISIILQGNRSVGQLTELLSRIQNDFANNGKLDDENILNTLRTSTLGLDFKEIRKNVENRLKELDNSSPIPDFETQIRKFFNPKKLNITIEGEGTVEERIVTNPSVREYPINTVVELTPIPKDGWVFESWEGDLSGSEFPKTILVDKEKNVAVKFKTNPNFYLHQNEITCICSDTKPGDKGFINGVEIESVDNVLLRRRRSEGVDMTKLCTSLVTNMNSLFRSSQFNQPIGSWDVSNVTNMREMFSNSQFNQPIGDWDVSNVTDMTLMFTNSPFNQTIGNWNVSKVTSMRSMFANSPFNQTIGNWDVSNVIEMEEMFSNSQFNQPIGSWDVSNVHNMMRMFGNSQFNQPIGDWDVSNVTNMIYMFWISQFNQPIGDWDVSNVTNMREVFHRSQFNRPIGDWDVSNVTDMTYMFAYSPFNQPIGNWDVSNVTNTVGMFRGSLFNHPIGNWDVSNVFDMEQMFWDSQFNQPIGNWDVSNVHNMIGMFRGSLFNQPIGNWDVSNVFDMEQMFWDSQFNQPIGNWDVSNVHNMIGMFRGSQFNQNISKWCGRHLGSEPDDFSINSPLTAENKPKWERCPN